MSENWALNHAKKIIKMFPDSKKYVCASGITPSGLIHIGNFREFFTVEVVSNEIKKLGKNVRHFHSWDSFDPFRKIPKNLPKDVQEEYKKYLGMCIADIPDPWGTDKSYAHHFINIFENELKKIGCKSEFLYQHEIYRSCAYKDLIKKALNQREKIIENYNKFRKEPLPKNWWPVFIYCDKCKKITEEIVSYDGEYTLEYKCKCGNHQKIDFSKNGNVKLRWRVCWPMRWKYYGENFEPSGKDHMSSGGSNELAHILVKEIFNGFEPYSFMYEFIGIKGGEGKMSSSKGNVLTITDILKYYLPEILRFIFISTKPSSTFDIQLDENIFQVYSDFYETEKKYYEENNKNKIYEISNPWKPSELPIQPKLQEFVKLSQILKEDTVDFYIKINNITKKSDIQRIKQIYKCSINWLKDLAPEKYILKENNNFDENIKKIIVEFLENNPYSDDYQNNFYSYLKENNINVKEGFKNFYALVFKKEVGPKFGNVIKFYGVNYILDKIR